MEGKFVLVYDGDLVGYVLGVIKEDYPGNRALIETMDGTSLVRFIKATYKEIKQDGCGYVLKVGKCRLCNKSNIIDGQCTLFKQ